MVRAAALRDEWVGQIIKPSKELDELLTGIRRAEAKGLLRVSDKIPCKVAPTDGMLSYVYFKFSELPEGMHLVKGHPLSKREYDALKAAASLNYNGMVTLRVSKVLGIRPTTARNHVQNIREILGVHDTASAVYLSLHNGYLSFEEIVNENLQKVRKRYTSLTRAEKEVLSAFAVSALEGDTSAAKIAEKNKPVVSPFTVKTTLYHMYKKVKLSGRYVRSLFSKS